METPTCDLSVTTDGYDADFTISNVDTTWTDFVSLDYGDGTTEGSLDTAILVYDHTYATGASYT